MRTLRKGLGGKDVKILQGLLIIHGYDISVGYTFNDKTLDVVKQFQKDVGLEADGIVGTNTWKALGIVKPVNEKICTFKIPLSALESQRILLKNNEKWNVGKFGKTYGCNFVVNGGMFDTKTLRNVQDMIIAGRVDNGGNYSNKGLALCNDRKVGSIYASTTLNSTGKPVDFIGGSPTLILNGEKNIDMKGLNRAYYVSVTKRVCYGCDKENFYLMITINNCNLDAMVEEGLAHKIETLINVDGGGSQSLYLGNETVIPTDGRSIPSALGLKIKPFAKKVNTTTTVKTESKAETKTESTQKEETVVSKTAPVVILDAGHNELTSGKRSPDGTYREYEFNANLRDRMKAHLVRHGVKVVYADSKNATPSVELKEIVNQANASKGDIFVSLHSNAYGTTWNSANGWEVFCHGTNKTTKGYKLAKLLHDESIPKLGLTDRGIKDGSHLYVIKNTNMPAALIEHAFHTNKNDTAKLKDPNFREEAAICNVKGILKYFGINWIEPKGGDNTSSENTEGGTLYRVQVGALKSKTNAYKLAAELRVKGYNTVIIFDSPWYRVQVGAYSFKKNAEALATELKAKGYSTIIKEY